MPHAIRTLISRGYWAPAGESRSAGPGHFNSPELDKTMAAIRAAQEKGEDPFGDDDPINDADLDTSTVDEPDGDDDTDAVDATTDETPAGDKQADAAGTTDGKPAGDEVIDVDALAAVAGDEDDDELPTYEVPNVDFKAERKKLDEEEAAIEAKWADGALTDPERAAELSKLRDQRETIVRQETRAETIADLNKQAMLHSTKKVLNAIAAASKAAGELDYADQRVAQAYDGMLQAVMGDPENKGKKFKELAQLAHDGLCAVKNVTRKVAETAPAAADKGKPAVQVTTQAKDRTPPKVPVTLRGVPNAATPNTGGGPLEALAGLKGQAYQHAYNSLPPHLKAQLLDD